MPTEHDLIAEGPVLFSEGKETLPRSPSYFQLWKYSTIGSKIRGRPGRIKLEYVTMPNGMATSVQAFLRFLRRLSEAKIEAGQE